MPFVDFNSYNLQNPNGHIVVSGDGEKVTWTNLWRTEDAWVSKNYGLGTFTGDIEHLIHIQGSLPGSNGIAHYHTLSSIEDDFQGVDAALGDAFSLQEVQISNSLEIRLVELDGGTRYFSGRYALSQNTDYWGKFWIDSGVGSYGQLNFTLYSDANRLTPLTTLSITIHGSVKDLPWHIVSQSFNDSATAWPISGFINEVDLQLVPVGGGRRRRVILARRNHVL